MSKGLYEDGPFYEVAHAAEALVLKGNIVYQKWTCGFCGERITMAQPNTFYKVGKHEGCDVNPTDETNILDQGCNYLVIQAGSKKGQDYLSHLQNL